METDSLAHGPDLMRRRLLGALGLLAFPTAALSGTAAPRLVSPVNAGGANAVMGIPLPTVSQASLAANRQPAALPTRGHGIAVDPRRPNEVLVVARRPGTILVRLDLDTGHILRQREAQENRHFFGHACFSKDGRRVFLTENDIDTGLGLVTLRDADTLHLLEEWPSHGIGPHDLILMPDETTLAVANGGILTLPETGRVKRNLGRIDSSLVYLDSRDGTLLGKFPVPLRDASLRHLAVSPNGRVGAALQFEGNSAARGVPLLVFHEPDSPLVPAEAPGFEWDAMRHYAASIAYDPVSANFALSCPKGGRLACWHAAGHYTGSIAIHQVSGIVFSKESGYASNESGDLFVVDVAQLSASLIHHANDLRWDNHLFLA